MTLASKLSYNILSTIFLANKKIKMFLIKAGKFFEIVIDNKVFDLVNIIKK